jgi:hypothetical protein
MDLARRLLAAGILSPAELGAALLVSVQKGVPLALAFVQAKALTEAELEAELAQAAGQALRLVQPAFELCAQLPAGAPRRLGAVPVRRDPMSGVVDVAAIDPLDGHVARELSFHLVAPVRMLRARAAAVEEAIRRVEQEAPRPPAPKRLRCNTPAYPHGAPLSWRPSSEDAEPTSGAQPIPLVRKTAAPAPGDPDDAASMRLPSFPVDEREVDGEEADVAVPLGRTKAVGRAPGADAASASGGLDEPSRHHAQRPAVHVDVPPPRARATGTTPPAPRVFPSPLAPARPRVRRTLMPPGRLAVPAPDEDAAVGPPISQPISAPARPIDASEPRAFLTGAASAAGGVEPAEDLADLVAALRRASTRDAVIELTHRGLAKLARRTALLAVRRDGYCGWTCNAAFGDPAAFRAVVVPMDQPSLFRTAGATSIYLGPVPETPAHASLLAVMGRATADVAAISVRVAGRPAMILLVDELEDTLTGTRRMDELARAAGEALARVLGAR